MRSTIAELRICDDVDFAGAITAFLSPLSICSGIRNFSADLYMCRALLTRNSGTWMLFRCWSKGGQCDAQPSADRQATGDWQPMAEHTGGKLDPGKGGRGISCSMWRCPKPGAPRPRCTLAPPGVRQLVPFFIDIRPFFLFFLFFLLSLFFFDHVHSSRVMGVRSCVRAYPEMFFCGEVGRARAYEHEHTAQAELYR